MSIHVGITGQKIEENLMILCFLEVTFEAEGFVFNPIRANVALI